MWCVVVVTIRRRSEKISLVVASGRDSRFRARVAPYAVRVANPQCYQVSPHCGGCWALCSPPYHSLSLDNNRKFHFSSHDDVVCVLVVLLGISNPTFWFCLMQSASAITLRVLVFSFVENCVTIIFSWTIVPFKPPFILSLSSWILSFFENY